MKKYFVSVLILALIGITAPFYIGIGVYCTTKNEKVLEITKSYFYILENISKIFMK